MKFSDLPRERQQRILDLAAALWSAGWKATAQNGSPPDFASLSTKNKRRYVAMAFHAEAYAAKLADDVASWRAVLGSAIRALESLRDNPFGKGDESDARNET